MSFTHVRFGRVSTLIGSALLLTLAPMSAFGESAPVHVSNAETVLSELTVSRQNAYGSDPSYIKWNGNSSSARTVCGTFITNLLMHSYSFTANTFSSWMGSTSPYAQDYHDTIIAQKDFAHITDITQVKPGDIIAVKYLSGASQTGHAMMVDSVPKAQAAISPVISGTTQYAVTVIDSSSQSHGKTDTRVTSPSSTKNGIDRGDIRVYVNSSHQPVGYTWSNESGSTYYTQSARNLAIDRVDLTNLGAKVQNELPGSSANDVTVVTEARYSGLSDDDSTMAPDILDAADPTMDAQATGCSVYPGAQSHAGNLISILGIFTLLGFFTTRKRA